LRLWPALLCNRGKFKLTPLQKDSEEWLSDKTRPCPYRREGDEGPSALAFSEYRPFSFRKPISMVACFIDLLVNSKAMQPIQPESRERITRLLAFPGIEFVLSINSGKLK
jgi:hypothetical protein